MQRPTEASHTHTDALGEQPRYRPAKLLGPLDEGSIPTSVAWGLTPCKTPPNCSTYMGMLTGALN